MADIFTNGEFDKLSLVDRLERLRKEYCTGPCGQSNSVHCRREATNRTLKEAREFITCAQKNADSDLEWKKVD